METKLIPLGDLKFATNDVTETGTKTFSGYGAVFGNKDSYGDVIAPGAFKATLKSGNQPLMFLNHDPSSLPIGKWTKIEEDEIGLKVEGEFLDTANGRDTYTATKAGAISGLSIGFRVTDFSIGKTSAEAARTLKSLDLLEISVVTFPANTKARINDIKSFVTEDDNERELIRLGLSALEAKTFVANIKDRVEAKYLEAAELVAARNLLSKLQGES